MTPEIDDVLSTAPRLVLGLPGSTPGAAPLVTPMAFWWDGGHLWLTTAGSTTKAERLVADGAVTAYVRPERREAPGVLLRGAARIFSVRDPLGTLVHGPTVSAAMAALAWKNAGSVAGYAQDIARLPLRWWPHNRVAVRVTVTDASTTVGPVPGPGIAPALPPDVPAGVRRALGGERRVVLAVHEHGVVRLLPAVWGAGWSIDVGDQPRPPDGTVAVVADADARGRPSEVVGVCVVGRLEDGRVLRPTRVRWWEGFTLGATDVEDQRKSAFVLPD